MMCWHLVNLMGLPQNGFNKRARNACSQASVARMLKAEKFIRKFVETRYKKEEPYSRQYVIQLASRFQGSNLKRVKCFWPTQGTGAGVREQGTGTVTEEGDI